MLNYHHVDEDLGRVVTRGDKWWAVRDTQAPSLSQFQWHMPELLHGSERYIDTPKQVTTQYLQVVCKSDLQLNEISLTFDYPEPHACSPEDKQFLRNCRCYGEFAWKFSRTATKIPYIPKTRLACVNAGAVFLNNQTSDYKISALPYKVQ